MVIKRIGAMSVAKVAGILYAGIGLLFGAVVSLIAVASGGLGGSQAGFAGMLFGAAAVVVLPIVYGCMGVIGSLIGVSLFNVAASVVGGVEIETE